MVGMPVCSRTSLASTIRPSTPFLALGLLPSPAPRALYTQCSRRSWAAGFIKKSNEPSVQTHKHFHRENAPIRKHGALREPEQRRFSREKAPVKKHDANREHERRSQALEIVTQLRSACAARSINLVMDLYPSVLETRLLKYGDTLRIAAAIHTVVRNLNRYHPSLQGVYPFIQRFVQDIRAGNLPPHPSAHVHLLGIFKSLHKFDEGYAFWSWLQDQGDDYVAPSVYGAAIELMTYGGKGTLSDLEGVYMDALKRFPGTFAAYHLSPNAIIPNRDQPIAVEDLPILLLQGILTARILSGEWKNAYLALDTALRLYPTQTPTRFFELFMTERPLQEAYTAYLIACRAGIVFKQSHLTNLMKKIQTTMTLSTSLFDRVVLLRAIANAMYAYQESGGALSGVHVRAFINAFTSLLPEKNPGDEYVGVEAEYRNVIVSTAHTFVSQLLQAGMPRYPELFTALINLAGSQRVASLLHATLQDAQLAKVDLGDVGRRIALKSAGLVGDKALLAQCWTQLVTLSEKQGQQLSFDDWVTFAKACKKGNQITYCRDEMARLEHTITTHIAVRLDDILGGDESQQPLAVNLTGQERFLSSMQGLKDQLNNIITVVMSGQPMDLKKTPFYMTIDPLRTPPLGTLEDMRTIYDEYTVDPHQPPPRFEADEAKDITTALTGISLGELRFQNWVSITEMMYQAHVFEIEMKYQGLNPNQKPYSDHNIHLTKSHRKDFPLPLATLRARIKEIRAPAPITLPDNISADRRPLPEHKPTSSAVQTQSTTSVPLRRRPTFLDKKRKHPLGLQPESTPKEDELDHF